MKLMAGVMVSLLMGARALAAEPVYMGHPTLPKLARIVPKINLHYAEAAEVPVVVHADAEGTVAEGVEAPLEDLEFRWDFGGAVEKVVNPVSGKPVDLNKEQVGPYAAGLYRRPGRYVVTLTVRGRTGSKYVTGKVTEVVVVGAWNGAVREFPPGDAQPVFDFLAGGDRRTAVLREGVYTEGYGAVAWGEVAPDCRRAGEDGPAGGGGTVRGEPADVGGECGKRGGYRRSGIPRSDV